MIKAKLYNPLFTRKNNLASFRGRRKMNSAKLSTGAPLIGGKRYAPGVKHNITPAFYKRYKDIIDKHIAAGSLVLDVFSGSKAAWNAAVAESPDMNIHEEQAAEQRKAQIEKLEEERVARVEKAEEQKKKKIAAKKAHDPRIKVDAQKEVSDVVSDLGFLSDVAPAQMSDAQRKAMEQKADSEETQETASIAVEEPVTTSEEKHASATSKKSDSSTEKSEAEAEEKGETPQKKTTTRRRKTTTRRRRTSKAATESTDTE